MAYRERPARVLGIQGSSFPAERFVPVSDAEMLDELVRIPNPSPMSIVTVATGQAVLSGTTVVTGFLTEPVSVWETHPLSISTMRMHVRDADLRERRELASTFARRARDLGVTDVYAICEPDLVVTVAIPERDLELELNLQVAFTHLAAGLSDPGHGELRIRELDELPERTELGESIA